MANETRTLTTFMNGDSSKLVSSAEAAVAALKKVTAAQKAQDDQTAQGEVVLAKRTAAMERSRRAADAEYRQIQTLSKEYADWQRNVERGSATLEEATMITTLHAQRVLKLGDAFQSTLLPMVQMVGTQKTINELMGVGAAASKSAADSVSFFGSELDRLRDKYVPLARETRNYRDALSEIRSLEKAQELTATQAAAAIERTKEAFAAQVTAVKIASRAVDEYTASLWRQTSAQDAINKSAGVTGGGGDGAAAASAAALGAELDRLRAKYVPLAKVKQDYVKTLMEIREGERVGALTTQQAADAAQTASTAYVRAIKGTQDLGKAHEITSKQINLATYQLTNLGYQFQDFFVQIVSGQSAILAFAQQAPQAVGAVGGMSNALTLLRSPIVAAAAAFVTLAAPIAIVTLRALDLQSQARNFSVAIRGMGRDAEISTAQLVAMVEKMRDLGVSKDDARTAITTAVRNPNLSAQGVQRITALAPDFAAGTGQDVGTASKAIADALAGGSDSALKLADAYRLLTPAQKDVVRQFYEMGQAGAGANVVLSAIEQRFNSSARNAMSEFAKALLDIGRSWSTWLDKIANSKVTLDLLDRAASNIKAISNLVPGYEDANPVATLEAKEKRLADYKSPLLFDFAKKWDEDNNAKELAAVREQLAAARLANRSSSPTPGAPIAGAFRVTGSDAASLQKSLNSSGPLQIDNSTYINQTAVNLGRNLNLIGADARTKALGQADIASANEIATRGVTDAGEKATIVALKRAEAMVQLDDAIAKTTKLTQIDTSQTLLVADAYLKSASDGAEALRVKQALIDKENEGVDPVRRAAELRQKAVNEAITQSGQSINALREQADAAGLLAEAERGGADAVRIQTIANKVRAATIDEEIAKTKASGASQEKINELIATKAGLIEREANATQNAYLIQQKRAAADEIDIESRKVQIAQLTDVNERQRASIDLARQQQIIALRNDKSLDDAGRAQLLSQGDKLRALQDTTRFYDEVRQQAQGLANDVSSFLVDGFVNANQGGKSAFENLWAGALAGAKRFIANIAAEFLKQKILIPIAMEVVGGAPSVFGIANPGGASGSNSLLDMLGSASKGIGGNNSLFGGVTNGINDYFAKQFPGIFSGSAATTGAVQAGLSSGTAGAGTIGPGIVGTTPSSVGTVGDALSAGGNVGATGGVTALGAAGGALGIAGGAFQLANAKGTGSTIAGISSIAAGIMAFTPLAPFAPLVAIGGQLLGSLIGDKKPTVGPGGGAQFGVDATGKAKLGITDADNKYDPSTNQGAADFIGATAKAFFDKIGGTFKGTSKEDVGGYLGYDAGLKKYIGGDSQGSAQRYDTIDQAVAAALAGIIRNADITGLGPTLTQKIHDVASPSDVDALLQYIDGLNTIVATFRDWKEPLTDVQSAVKSLDDAFAQAKDSAKELGKPIDDLTKSYNAQKAYLTDQFNAPLKSRYLRATGQDQAADLADFDRAAAETRKSAAALGNEAILQAERTLGVERAAIVRKYTADVAAAMAQNAVNTLQGTYNGLVDELKRAQQVQIDGLTQTRDKWAEIIKSLQAFRDSLLVGQYSPLSPLQQMTEAQRQFADAVTKAQGGDVEAAGQVQGLAETALGKTQDYYASSQPYADYFQQVQAQLAMLQTIAGTNISAADRQLAAMQSTAANTRSIADITKDIAEVLRQLAGAQRNVVTQQAGGNATVGNAIFNAYTGSLGRDPDTAGSAYWTAQVTSGAQTLAQAVTGIANSPEAQVYKAYQDILGRAPDAAGGQFYQSLLLGGASVDSIRASISGSAEAQARGFAAGGEHFGGGRVVGETGKPEFEITGPARIFNFEQAQKIFGGNDNSAAAEARALRREVAELREALVAATAWSAQHVAGAVRRGSEADTRMANAASRAASAPSSNAA